MTPPHQESSWEKEFEARFDKPHSQMTHIGDKVKRRDCEICKESRRKNPKGYSRTFLTEQKCYWNQEMSDDVKAFIAQTRADAVREERECLIALLPQDLNFYSGLLIGTGTCYQTPHN